MEDTEFSINFDNVKVFDVHEHFVPPYYITEKRIKIREILRMSYVGNFDFYPSLRQPVAPPIDPTEIPEDLYGIIRILKQYKSDYDYLKAIDEGLKFIYGTRIININPNTLQELEYALNKKYEKWKEHYLSVIHRLNIKYIITDIYYDNFGINFGNYFGNVSSPQFFASIRLNSLLFGFNPALWDSRTCLPLYFKNTGVISEYPDNFDAYLDMVDKFLEWASDKFILFKCASAYERSIDFGSPEILENKNGSYFNTLFNKPPRKITLKSPRIITEFGNYIIHYIMNRLECNQKLRKPIQIHTGMAIRSGSHPYNLKSLIETYPSVNFGLLHCGFPDVNAAINLCKKFPNVYLEAVWIPQLSRKTLEKLITTIFDDESLWDRFIGFGGDCGCIEGTCGALITLKKILATVYSRLPNTTLRKDYSEFVEYQLYRNAARIYCEHGHL